MKQCLVRIEIGIKLECEPQFGSFFMRIILFLSI